MRVKNFGVVRPTREKSKGILLLSCSKQGKGNALMILLNVFVLSIAADCEIP